MKKHIIYLTSLFYAYLVSSQNEKQIFNYLDVFEIQYASEPKINPSGKLIVYRKMRFDKVEDKSIGNLWIIDSNGTDHQKLTSFDGDESNPVWSPTGDRIAFIRKTNDGPEIYVFWLSTKKTARISNLESIPSNLSWSKDGKKIAFTMKVSIDPPILVELPKKPKNANWAKSPRITDRLYHEKDGTGYIEPGYTHVFIISSEGSGETQLTFGDFNHYGNLSWSNDNSKIYFTTNRSKDWEYDFRNSEIGCVLIEKKEITILTTRVGPDFRPKVSPDGKFIAYLGYKDKLQAYQNETLSVMTIEGNNSKVVSLSIDSSINDFNWDSSGKGIYVSYDLEGDTKISYLNLSNNKSSIIGDQLGGTTIGRPYGGGSFSVAKNGIVAYTFTNSNHPAEIRIVNSKGKFKLTNISDYLLKNINLATIKEIWYKSSFDGRKIQGWIAFPPNYDSNKRYKLLVENHGGPISNYGNRFSPEIQLYASNNYMVFYPNPRGSTSYGEEFANLLHHNYPGEDYIDVMDGVNYLIEKGYAHEDKLYVTGGSAGGIMTSWIIGKNNRFKAAAVVKPVVNWISKTLVADNYFSYADTRFPGQPFENFDVYWKFSPLSLVGNIKTPTMVMVGMEDLRTPPSEAKQLYHALKIRRIPTILVEIPGASHFISKRPSNLISKISNIIAWLNKY